MCQPAQDLLQYKDRDRWYLPTFAADDAPDWNTGRFVRSRQLAPGVKEVWTPQYWLEACVTTSMYLCGSPLMLSLERNLACLASSSNMGWLLIHFIGMSCAAIHV